MVQVDKYSENPSCSPKMVFHHWLLWTYITATLSCLALGPIVIYSSIETMQFTDSVSLASEALFRYGVISFMVGVILSIVPLWAIKLRSFYHNVEK